MTKKSSVLRAVFMCIFILGIFVGLTGRDMCVRDTKEYQELQKELFAPDEIEPLLYDEAQKQLYVCYRDATYVNVYNEEGEFLWAVSTPYIRHPYFELQEGRLIIYNSDAYIYSAADGRFLDCVNAEEMDLEYRWEREAADYFKEGEFYFDTYQVYRGGPGGALEEIVSRPWWYWCFNFGVCWVVSFAGGIAYCVTTFLVKRKNDKLAKARKAERKAKKARKK